MWKVSHIIIFRLCPNPLGSLSSSQLPQLDWGGARRGAEGKGDEKGRRKGGQENESGGEWMGRKGKRVLGGKDKRAVYVPCSLKFCKGHFNWRYRRADHGLKWAGTHRNDVPRPGSSAMQRSRALARTCFNGCARTWARILALYDIICTWSGAGSPVANTGAQQLDKGGP